MKNRIEQYPEIKRRVFNETLDKKLAQDWARADDDGFAIIENNFGEQPTDQDLDCWSDLWQRIGAKYSRFLSQKK